VTALLAILLIVATAAACAALLRGAGAPGWATLGGIMAGLLLGPVILGRVSPDFHERLFVGGQAERQKRDSLAIRHGAERLVIAPHLGATTENMRRDEVRRTAEMDAAIARLLAARRMDQRPLLAFTLALAFVALLSASTRPPTTPDLTRLGEEYPDRSTASSHPVTSLPLAPRSTDWLSIGLWSATLPGAMAFFACSFLFDCSVPQSLAVAAAISIGPSLAFDASLRTIDDGDPGSARTIILAGIVASVLAAILWIASILMQPLEWTSAFLLLPLAALPVRWLLDRTRSRDPIAANPVDETSVPSAGMLRPPRVPMLLHWMVLPSLAALAAIRIDVLDHTRLWPMLLFLLLSDDGRWAGSFLGSMLAGGRTALAAMRLAVPAVAAAPTQLALTAVLVSAARAPETILWPLQLGVAVIESTYGLRLRMLGRLAQLERELQPPADRDDLP